MKYLTMLFLILPPVFLVVLVARSGMASEFTVRLGANFLTPAVLVVMSSLACLVRGVWIFKSQRRLGWICIALGIFYILFLAMIAPVKS